MNDAAPPTASDAAPVETDAMFSEVYERLKAMAGRQLARGARGTLDTTALVHDLYLRVQRNEGLTFARPEQFFAYAARAMRHLLADRARDRQRLRAGGDWVRIDLAARDERLALAGADEALALEEALGRLEAVDARAARVTEPPGSPASTMNGSPTSSASACARSPATGDSRVRSSRTNSADGRIPFDRRCPPEP